MWNSGFVRGMVGYKVWINFIFTEDFLGGVDPSCLAKVNVWLARPCSFLVVKVRWGNWKFLLTKVWSLCFLSINLFERTASCSSDTGSENLPFPDFLDFVILRFLTGWKSSLSEEFSLSLSESVNCTFSSLGNMVIPVDLGKEIALNQYRSR